VKPPYKFDAANNEITYRAKEVVGVLCYLLIALAKLGVGLIVSVVPLWISVTLGLPG